MAMRVVHERCAGLDVHKKTIVVCALTPDGSQVRSFGTMTDELMELADWLDGLGCRDVAMESTGVYWKPVYNVLEALEFRAVVANAQHIKTVPGRKTDVNDAEWIADLHRHGLLPTSFIPDREQRELRELVRYRRSVVQERAREASRIQKVLEGANIKLASVASDVLGVSGREMLRRLAEGVEDPQELAKLARGRLKDKHADLVRALRGVVGPHQRLVITEQLDHVEELEQRIARLDAEIGKRLRPFDRQLDALQTTPGVGRRVAEDVIAEIGTDMSRFPSPHHLASWAKMCPGNNKTGGKSKSGRTGHGNKWLRSSLVEAAWGASRTKNTYLSAQYRHLARRIGRKRAAVAVGHTILTIIYFIVRDNVEYKELGPTYLDERHRDTLPRALTKRLERLDFNVKIEDRRVA